MCMPGRDREIYLNSAPKHSQIQNVLYRYRTVVQYFFTIRLRLKKNAEL